MFQNNTRRKLVPLSSQSKGTTNPVVWEIPKTGLLAGIFLSISGSVAGTLSAPNALGMASIVRRVRLIANTGIDIINISGPGYHYLLRDNIEDFRDPVPSATARNAVTATTFDVSMYLPVAYNSRDPLGLIMLQNEQLQLLLQVEFETDSVVATGATVTATVQPFCEIFTVPVDKKNWPPLDTVHQIVEESRTISGAGEYQYSWPRGNTYVGVYHGAGMAQSPSDLWTSVKVALNQSDTIYGPLTPAGISLDYTRAHGRARLLGTIPFDLSGSSGLGCFGSLRDAIYSQLVTDLATFITFSGAATLYTVRRQLVALA